jgi:hypothetical protein
MSLHLDLNSQINGDSVKCEILSMILITINYDDT